MNVKWILMGDYPTPKTVPEPPGTAQIAESAKEMEEKPPAMRASARWGQAVIIWS